jgi:hypothetical protein
MNEYKIVVIDSFYESISNDFTKEFIPKIIEARKNGYNSRHDKNYLPFAIDDMVANHLAICRFEDHELVPVCVARIIDTRVCGKYGIEHPLISMMRGNYSDGYFDFVKQKIDAELKSGSVCSYSGGFTVNRPFIKSQEEVEFLKEVYCACHALIHIDRSIDIAYGFSAPRVGTDKIFSKWGIRPIYHNGGFETKMTPGINQMGIPMRIDLKELSEYSLAMMEKHAQLWNLRLDTINKESIAA